MAHLSDCAVLWRRDYVLEVRRLRRPSLSATMVRGGERKQPIWSTIPVPGTVTARRDTNQQQRKMIAEKRKLEQEEEKRRSRETEEVARIIAARWSAEDKRGRVRREEDDEDRDAAHGSSSSTKRRRFEEEPGSRARAEEGDGERRRDRDSRRDDGSEDEVEAESREPQVLRRAPASRDAAELPLGSSGWEVAQERPPSRILATSSSLGATATKKEKAKAKIGGVFGLSDSDDEEGKARREIERIARSKRAKLAPGEPAAAAPLGATPTPTLSASAQQLMTAEVHMKYSQWKLSCKNRYMPMPEDLKKAVASVMGSGGKF